MENTIINTQNQLNCIQNQNNMNTQNDIQRAYTNVTRLNVGESLSHQKTVKREVRRVIIEEIEEVVDKTIPEMWVDVVREIGGRRITRISVLFGFDKYPIGGTKNSRRLCMMLDDTDCTLIKNTHRFKIVDRKNNRELYNIVVGDIGEIKLDKVGKEGRTDKYVLLVHEVDMGYWRFDIDVSSNRY